LKGTGRGNKKEDERDELMVLELGCGLEQEGSGLEEVRAAGLDGSKVDSKADLTADSKAQDMRARAMERRLADSKD